MAARGEADYRAGGGWGHFAEIWGLSRQFHLRLTPKKGAITGHAGSMMGMSSSRSSHGRGLQMMLLLVLRMRILLGRALLMKRMPIIAHHLDGRKMRVKRNSLNA